MSSGPASSMSSGNTSTFIASLTGRVGTTGLCPRQVLEEQGTRSEGRSRRRGRDSSLPPRRALLDGEIKEDIRPEGKEIMSAKKTAFMRWMDGELRADKDFARRVDELVNEMKIEQELVALRERRGISQRAAAKLIGASQPFVAKLESGRVKNLGVKTLVKYATALGGKLTLRIDPARIGSKTTRRTFRRAS